MKLLIILSLLFSSLLHAHETTIEKLQDKLKIAIKAKDTRAITSLYDWTNVHFIFKDQELLRWKRFFETDLKDYAWKSIKWVPLDEFEESDKESFLSAFKIGDRMYSWNYKMIGRFDIVWQNKTNKNSEYTNWVLIGKNKALKYVAIAQSVKVNNKIITK